MSKIKSKQATNKVFEYEKEGLTLKFTLNIDSKKDLAIFKDIMSEGLKDLDKELEKYAQPKQS